MTWSKRLAILLAVSIGLNLTLLGMLIGSRFHGRGHGPRLEHDGRFPPSFEKSMRRERQNLAAHRGAAARARADAEAVLAKEPFDRAALDEALRRLRAETQGSQEVVHRVLADAAAALPRERRVELGGVLARGGRMGRRGGGPLRDPLPDPSAD